MAKFGWLYGFEFFLFSVSCKGSFLILQVFVVPICNLNAAVVHYKLRILFA